MSLHGPTDSDDGFLDLRSSAGWFGLHRFVERSLFELTGRWSNPGPASSVAAGPVEFFSTQSANHGWRLAEWVHRSPRSVEVLEDPGATGWHDALERAGACTDPLSRLVTWVHVLGPWLAASYRTHAGLLAPAADGGVLRWLRIAETDVVDAVAAGGALLGELGAGVPEPGPAAVAAGDVLAALLAGG